MSLGAVRTSGGECEPVYVSLPLAGPQARYARDLLRGAELAAGDGRRSSCSTGEPADNARRAAADPGALAYLGDFHSNDVAVTPPILGDGRAAPGRAGRHLDRARGPTLVRLSPHDGAGARAIASWLAERGRRPLLLIHDHDDGYGLRSAAMCADAAREPGWPCMRCRSGTARRVELGDAEAVLYVGVAGSGAIGLWHALHARGPDLWLLGSEGVAVPWLARALEPPVPPARASSPPSAPRSASTATRRCR